MPKCPPDECEWPACDCPKDMWPGSDNPAPVRPQRVANTVVHQPNRPPRIIGAGLGTKTVKFDGDGEGIGTGHVAPGGMKVR